jgi:cof-like hydrolase
MIKAVFFDIDGTLVSFKTHRVPDSAKRAIAALRAKGVRVFIASGRQLLAINNLEDLQFDGYVTLNGGYCIVGEQVIYKHSMPSEDMVSLVQYMEEREDFPCIFVHENAFCINYTDERTDEVFRLLNFPQPPTLPLREAATGDIFQLVAFFTKKQEKAIMAVMPHCEATRWNPLFSDVIPKGSSKQVGVDKMLDYFGISLDESMAFGDGGNDVLMLKHVGIGVAMGNAEDEVKRAADYVTDSVDEDGVEKALRHFGVI